MVVTALKVVHKYNETMDGVDLGDQLLLKFEPQFKSIKLIRKVLFNLLTTATGILVNAHFWYRNSFLVQTKMDHVRFQHSIIKCDRTYRDGIPAESGNRASPIL